MATIILMMVEIMRETVGTLREKAVIIFIMMGIMMKSEVNIIITQVKMMKTMIHR